METATATNEESFESFEDQGDWSESSTENAGNDDDWSVPDESKEAKEEKKDEAMKLLDDTDVDGDGKVVDKEDKKPKEEKKDKKEETEEEDDAEEDEEDKAAEDKPESEESKAEEKKEVKNLRVRINGELHNVPSDATFKAKVDGQDTEVTIQELINDYSGRTAWDKKFTEIGKDRKMVEFEKGQISQQKQHLEKFVSEALAPILNPESNPMDAFLFMAEKSGVDPSVIYERIILANIEETDKLSSMSDVERKLYIREKKDEFRSKLDGKRQERATMEEGFNRLQQKVASLRQAYNLSEDDFVDASDELEEKYKVAGLDTSVLTPEDVVDYASLRSILPKVEKLAEPYLTNISDEKYGDIVYKLSVNLRDGVLDEKAISELLKRNFSVEEEVKELNSKVYSKQSAKKPAKKVEHESSEYETFDDL